MYLLHIHIQFFLDDCLQGKVHPQKSAFFKQNNFRKNLNEIQIFHNYSKFIYYNCDHDKLPTLLDP